jgi:hypothetical protein
MISRILESPPDWLTGSSACDDDSEAPLHGSLRTAQLVLKEAFEIASAAASVQVG